LLSAREKNVQKQESRSKTQEPPTKTTAVLKATENSLKNKQCCRCWIAQEDKSIFLSLFLHYEMYVFYLFFYLFAHAIQL